MKLFTKSMEPNTTLGVAERVAYMSGNIGIALINTIVATFLMFFYTDVMMLNAGIIGTILMVSRLFDGVTDIIMGMIVDRTHSKYGKARVWVIRTCIPYAISGLLLVCVPGGMTELVQYIYVFITYNICNSVFLTALYVPYNAMTCNITSNPYERGVLGIFVLFGATFGTLAVQSTVDAATKALGGDQRAWQIVVGIYAICGLILHLICNVFYSIYRGSRALLCKRCLRRHCLLCTICKLYVCYTNDFSFYCICSDEKMGEEKYIDDWIDDYGNRNWYSVYLGK